MEGLNSAMNAYILSNKSHPLDPSLEKGLGELGVHFEKIALPKSHGKVVGLFEKKQPGAAFIPAAWEDLYCVKVVQEIIGIETPIEPVIVGAAPNVANIIVAFNEGLSAYLEVPFNKDKLKLILARVRKRLDSRLENIAAAGKLEKCMDGAVPYIFSPQSVERDQMLAAAFMNIINRDYPIIAGEVNVMLVTSSTAQQHRLKSFLKKVGLKVTTTGSMKEAVDVMGGDNFNLVISDSMLPDGDAITLVAKLRKTVKSHFPRIIVWSSSPDKAAELLKPETHIDDVIIKPGPGASIEHILPALISNIYQTI